MIKKKKANGVWVWQAYARAPVCQPPCTHSECTKGLTRKIYIGTFDSWKIAEGEVERITRNSIAVNKARDVLRVRALAIGVERDRLRQVVDEIEELIESCDLAHESLETALMELSKHV